MQLTCSTLDCSIATCSIQTVWGVDAGTDSARAKRPSLLRTVSREKADDPNDELIKAQIAPAPSGKTQAASASPPLFREPAFLPALYKPDEPVRYLAPSGYL